MSHAIGDQLLHRVRREFDEMPGLSLTDAQAARLWELPADEVDDLLQRLVEQRYLVRSVRGHYRRLSAV